MKTKNKELEDLKKEKEEILLRIKSNEGNFCLTFEHIDRERLKVVEAKISELNEF